MNHEVNIDNNKKKLKLYYGFLVTVICIIGASFAWFRLYLSQTENNTIASRTCFNTTLTEDTSKISLTDAFPITDEDGLEQTPFTFTIKNNCNSYVKVYVTIDSTYRESTDTSYLKDNYMKVNISSEGTTTGKSVILGSQTLTDLENNRKGYIIVSTGLKANEEKSYDLRIWMDSTVTTEQGLNKNWSGKIVVVSNAAEEPAPAPNGWYEAGSGTLLASLRDNNTLKTPITTPGAAVSTADEALLASTEDDYGTSYYFRGTVTNNYVEFANKCWRIVRVGGDGSVKLILHNDNPTGAANPCDAANNSEDAAFARYSKFNANYNDNAYVGFKYGTVDASDYATTHANTNKSTILTNLETWYTNNLKTYESVIDDNVWCNDKTNVTDTSYNPLGITPNGQGYAGNATYYGATQRLVSRGNSTGGTGPSLKCNGKLSKINSKVGLITADELAFAGYAFSLNNTTTYLQENATDTYWWSLSPNYFFRSYAYVWSVRGSSGYFNRSDVDFTSGVRPLISLVSSTTISGGSGTSEDPYVVN